MYKNYTKNFAMPSGYISKILLIMRLTTVILIASLMQVSAATFAQRITLSERKIPLEKLLKEIRRQSGYDFYYDRKAIALNKPISITVKDFTLEQALNKILEGLPLKYTIDEKIVVIKPKEPSFLDRLMASFSEIDVKGMVTDSAGNALPGAIIKIKGTNKGVSSNPDGTFFLRNVKEGETLTISYIGYTAVEIKAAVSLTVVLKPAIANLEEVSVASNGYQDIPKERSTGSFEVITAKMLQHSNSPNLLQRLEGITNSIVFNNTQSPTNSGSRAAVSVPGRQGSVPGYDYNGGYSIDNMTIRGRNSLANNSSAAPLVVIDGIASPYDISLVNPEDVESITILKDAASASIWGSRAANGVLVIKTKRGKLNQPLSVSLNTNFSVSEKLDLFYLQKMSVSDYIDAETYRFNQQKLVLPVPNPAAEGNPTLYSPVVEILDAINKGTLSAAAGNAQIDALRQQDLRRDQSKYLLRNQLTQNYSLNLGGGTNKVAYTVTLGYQNTQNNTVGANSRRINAAFNTQLKLIKNLDITAGVNFSTLKSTALGSLFLSPPTGDAGQYAPAFMPYTQLADDQGNPLSVDLHRPGFLTALSAKYGNKILDNSYRPLNDIDESYSKASNQNIGLTTDIRYRFNDMFSANVSYNYNFTTTNSQQFYSGDSYYMRNLINLYTDATTLIRRIPLGGLYIPQRRPANNQTLRGMLSFNKSWNGKNDINAIAGLDIADMYSLAQPVNAYYGYDPITLKTSNTIIYNTNYPLLYSNNQTGINAPVPNGPNGQFLESRLRTLGQFFNVAYTYNQRYTLSGSVRKDGNSTFGNKTNRTGTPFYHFGTSWNIDRESFYKIDWLSNLKLRYTFGYNGNTNPGPTAEPLITYATSSYRTLLPFASVSTLSNPELRPERTAIHNIGLDFGFSGSRISGSLEYFVKNTTDLLSPGPIDPTLGLSTAIYNVANLKGSGIDFGLNSTNLKAGKLSWGSNFHLSYNRVKVTRNNISVSAYAQQVVQGGVYIEGSNLTTMYAYQWAGLNPVNGEARVFVNGIPNNSMSSAAINSQISNLREIGSAVPVYYGNLGNTIQYAGFGLYANIMYKLGYFQRRPINALFMNNSMVGAEYADRWQKSGDELRTNVPSLDYARSISNPTNDIIYQYADINTYKADNIRLQEINLSYTFEKKTGFLKSPKIYLNMPMNIIIWRANVLGLDPDIYDFPMTKTYSFGFSASF